jgi:hypothetical protein
MGYRTLSLFLAILALALVASVPMPAGEAKKPDRPDMTHDGTVVSVTAEKLVMTAKPTVGESARTHTHTLSDNARVTCDGKACKLEDLNQGQRVRVTTRDGDRGVATRVEALDRNQDFEKSSGKQAERNGTEPSRR